MLNFGLTINGGYRARLRQWRDIVNNVIDISERVRPAPKPDTLNAVLFCDACNRVRAHEYILSREVKGKAITSREFELVYSCTECKVQRVWGNVIEKLR